MGKNRAEKLLTFLKREPRPAWLSAEGFRLIAKAYEAYSEPQRNELSNCMKLNLPMGSRDEDWRQKMRMLIWVNILLSKDAPKDVIAQATLKSYGGPGDFTPLLRLRIDRYTAEENKAAMDVLAEAANRVWSSYGSDMDSAYSAALQTFKAPLRPTNFRWHRCGQSDAAWISRISDELPMHGYNTGGKTGATEGAFTLSWKSVPPDLDMIGTSAPYNRCIEFPRPDSNKLIHEMLHFVTHESFSVAVGSLQDSNERMLIKEGTTEYLKRQLTRIDQGDYEDLMGAYRSLIGPIDLKDVKNAYFKGQNVQGFIDAVRQVRRAQEAPILAREENFARNALIGNLISTRWRLERASDGLKNKVYNAFKDLDDAAIRSQLGTGNGLQAGWDAYVINRKAAGRN